MKWISHWFARTSAIVLVAGILGGSGFWYFARRLPPLPQRPLRIGFEQNPPFQIRIDGGFGGLAIETVNEAAKRAGVRLQWVETGTSSDEAFQKGLVDLWPLMSDLPERRKRVHFSRPWLHSSHILLLRGGSATPEKRFTGRIAVFKMPLHVRILQAKFPDAQIIEAPDSREVVRQVCRGTVAAGFLEGRMAMTALREKPSECSSTELRVQVLPDLTFSNCIASTFETAKAAELLRREIGNQFRDGTLAAELAKYSYYGLDDAWATYNLMEAAERARWIAWGTGALALAFAVIFCQAISLGHRKRAERLVRLSEERFRAIFQQAAVGVAQVSLDGKIGLVNDRYCEVVGHAREDLIQNGTLEITYQKDLKEQLTMLRRLVAGEVQSFSTEKQYVRKDGTIVWARVFKSLVRDVNGQPKCVIAVVEDITEQIKATALLRKSEERLKRAQRLAHVGNWEWDIKANRIFCSEEIDRIFGKPQNDVPDYEGFLQQVVPQDRERVDRSLRDCLAGNSESSIEFQITRPDGDVRTVACVAELARDKANLPSHLFGASQDITERRRVETALRASEERFRNMADTVPVMIWVAGPDKLFTFFNKTWLDFTGRTMEQELGNGWVSSVHPEDRDQCCSSFYSSFDERREFQIEVRMRRADGVYRRMLCSGTPRFDGVVFAGYIGSYSDITELRRAQEEGLARQKLESLGVLTSGIGHEFNNLLGGILASAELVIAERLEGPVGEELLRIKTAAIRGGEIVRQLMVYSDPESGIWESVDILRLVGEMSQLLRATISKRAVLELRLAENLPTTIQANTAEIRQVVINLITNASEALGGKEGVISVTVARVHLGSDYHVTNLPHGDYIRLEISDTGYGMTEEVKARIFDPFFTTKFAGRGLGLAAVQGIIRRHGGAINVVTAPGQGTRFEVLLPYDHRPGKSVGGIAEPSSAREVEGLACTVLLVEDEETLRLAVSKMLRKRGIAVIEAANGQDGINLFRASAPHIDVVLLDLALPGISGGEVLAEVRQIQPDVKVIIATAYSKDWTMASLGRQQAWNYIRKPYTFGELEGLLRKICSRSE